jgi:hypothetical protein
LGTYKITAVISSWYITSSISMKGSSLSPFTNLDMKFTFSDISIATPAW